MSKKSVFICALWLSISVLLNQLLWHNKISPKFGWAVCMVNPVLLKTRSPNCCGILADTYSRITREIHVFSVSKWCIFSRNTPCISRVIHEYQPKLHVLHEKSLHRNGAMMEKSRIIAKFLIHNYPTWTLTTRGAIWCIWCNARGNGVLGVEEVYVE